MLDFSDYRGARHFSWSLGCDLNVKCVALSPLCCLMDFRATIGQVDINMEKDLRRENFRDRQRHIDYVKIVDDMRCRINAIIALGNLQLSILNYQNQRVVDGISVEVIGKFPENGIAVFDTCHCITNRGWIC